MSASLARALAEIYVSLEQRDDRALLSRYMAGRPTTIEEREHIRNLLAEAADDGALWVSHATLRSLMEAV